MQAKILIIVPCHNRKAIIEQCLPTIHDAKATQDYMVLANDGSTEYDAEFLKPWADEIWTTMPARGIEAQRRSHFAYYWARREIFSHLYLSDSDALHDPDFRTHLLGLQREHGELPVCGYNTDAHARMKGNTLEDDPKSNVIWRYYAPGISYLLTRAHVEAIAKFGILNLSHWDWDVPRILGHRFAVSRVSYVDHIGAGGLHHDGSAGYDGGDRCLNPTPLLRDMRKLAIEEIQSK